MTFKHEYTKRVSIEIPPVQPIHRYRYWVAADPGYTAKPHPFWVRVVLWAARKIDLARRLISAKRKKGVRP